EVFQATHQLVLGLIRDGKIAGLRIDHPDGLWNPKQYFEWLRTSCGQAGARLYILAEKILTGDERLPTDWPVEGTTGYDFMNRVNGLFVNRLNRSAFERLYREFTGDQMDFKSRVYASKLQVLRTSFVSDLDALAHRLRHIASSPGYAFDFTFRQLRAALAEVI